MTKIYDKSVSVNTTCMTDVQKKEVIDLFYELGIKWHINPNIYNYFDGYGFTNTCNAGRTEKYLMWCESPPQHNVVTLKELRQIVKEWKGESDMSKFKVGGVYKCGNGYVRIINDLSGEHYHPKGFYNLIGISCNKAGDHKSCRLGAFNNSGNFCQLNDLRLKHRLELVEEQPEIVELTLEDIASKLGVSVSSLRIKD